MTPREADMLARLRETEKALAALREVEKTMAALIERASEFAALRVKVTVAETEGEWLKK